MMTPQLLEAWRRHANYYNDVPGYDGSYGAGSNWSMLWERWQREQPGEAMPKVERSRLTGRFELILSEVQSDQRTS